VISLLIGVPGFPQNPQGAKLDAQATALTAGRDEINLAARQADRISIKRLANKYSHPEIR